MRYRAFTLLELIICIAILAIVAALMLPAVQYAREQSRRTQCSSNLRQITIAVHLYESSYRILPPGSNNSGYSLHVSILPFLENENVQNVYKFLSTNTLDVESVMGDPPDMPDPTMFNCPSDGATGIRRKSTCTNYAGNYGTGLQEYGYNGAFQHFISASTKWPEGPLTLGDFSDGLSNTASLSEFLVANGTTQRRRYVFETLNDLSHAGELAQFASQCDGGTYQMSASGPAGNPWKLGRPWVKGDAGCTLYNHILTPNKPSCTNGGFVQHGAFTATSNHASGVLVAFGDGHNKFIGDAVSDRVWKAIGSRNGNEVANVANR